MLCALFSEPISVGRTVLKYRANSNLMLSFNPSTPVKIFSKDMNDGGEIWGVEVRKLIIHSLGKDSIVAKHNEFVKVSTINIFLIID